MLGLPIVPEAWDRVGLEQNGDPGGVQALPMTATRTMGSSSWITIQSDGVWVDAVEPSVVLIGNSSMPWRSPPIQTRSTSTLG